MLPAESQAADACVWLMAVGDMAPMTPGPPTTVQLPPTNHSHASQTRSPRLVLKRTSPTHEPQRRLDSPDSAAGHGRAGAGSDGRHFAKLAACSQHRPDRPG